MAGEDRGSDTLSCETTACQMCLSVTSGREVLWQPSSLHRLRRRVLERARLYAVRAQAGGQTRAAARRHIGPARQAWSQRAPAGVEEMESQLQGKAGYHNHNQLQVR